MGPPVCRMPFDDDPLKSSLSLTPIVCEVVRAGGACTVDYHELTDFLDQLVQLVVDQTLVIEVA